MRLHRLCLESTLSTVRTDHISDALVTNKTGSPIHGVALGTYEVLDLSSSEESLSPPVAGVNAQTSDVTDLGDVIAPLMPHDKVFDYPDAKPALLKPLAQYRQAITRRTFWSDNPSHLTPNIHPIYIFSYRLPHNQKQVVQQKVDELLKEGVIQEPHSPWDSLFFLVHKRNRSYRPVIDFRKVNVPTVPDYYPLPVLSVLLQSVGKDNIVSTSFGFLQGS